MSAAFCYNTNRFFRMAYTHGETTMNILSEDWKFVAGAWMTLLAAIAPCVALAGRIEVPPPPVSPFADTEVTTNISFAAANGHVRSLELAFALDGCASN